MIIIAYQDVLTYKPKHVQVLVDEKQIQLIRDPQYNIIVRVLREGPMTVQEITEKYNKIIQKACTIDGKLEEILLEKKQRSEKSIYRYLKDLQKVGLLTVAGQRVIIGQTATQKLWSRTAKIFIFKTHSYRWWESEEGKSFAEKISKMLALLFPQYGLDCEKMHQTLIELNRLAEDEVENLFIEHPEEMDNIIGSCSVEDMNSILKELHTLILLFEKEKVAKVLERCSKSE